jgi:hypothetical protein
MRSGVLLAGTDTIKVNVKLLGENGLPHKVQALSEDRLTELETLQKKAQDEKKPIATALSFYGARLVMLPNGAPIWRYILKNDCIQVSLVPRLSLPMVAKVTFSSSYLWSVGNAQRAVAQVHVFLCDMLDEPLMLQAAQIDLCADVVGLDLPVDWQQVFVSHARSKKPIKESQKDKEYYRGPTLETIILSGHGNPVNGKLYEKVLEIKQHSPDKTWFHELWKTYGDWDGETSVWRVELSLERAGLHEMRLEDIYETIHNIKRLWHYCTHEWLRMVVPGEDMTRSRWQTADIWCKVQQAFDHVDGLTVEEAGPLIRKRKREKNIDRGVAAIAGYMTTLGAWDSALSNDGDMDALFAMVQSRVRERWEKKKLDLQSAITEKKFIYSQEP